MRLRTRVVGTLVTLAVVVTAMPLSRLSYPRPGSMGHPRGLTATVDDGRVQVVVQAYTELAPASSSNPPTFFWTIGAQSGQDARKSRQARPWLAVAWARPGDQITLEFDAGRAGQVADYVVTFWQIWVQGRSKYRGRTEGRAAFTVRRKV